MPDLEIAIIIPEAAVTPLQNKVSLYNSQHGTVLTIEEWAELSILSEAVQDEIAQFAHQLKRDREAAANQEFADAVRAKQEALIAELKAGKAPAAAPTQEDLVANQNAMKAKE